MKNITKMKIDDVLKDMARNAVSEKTREIYLNQIAKIIDEDFIKILSETFQSGELLEAVGLEIRSKCDPESENKS